MMRSGRRVQTVCLAVAAAITVFGVLYNFRLQSPDYKARCGPQFRDWAVNVSEGHERDDSFYWPSGEIVFPSGTFWTDTDGSVFGCPCAVKPCLRVCCEPVSDCGLENLTLLKSYISKVYTYPKLELKDVNDTHFYVFESWGCRGTCYPVKRADGPYLLEDGRLFTGSGYLYQSGYCLSGVRPVIDIPPRVITYRVRAVAMLISVPFMVSTIVVYTVLPALRTLPGLLLMSYLTCLTCASFITGSMHLFRDQLSESLCTFTAFAIQFAYLAYYFWLNVMCFDIWWMFSDLSSFRQSKSVATKQLEKRFLLYSCYGWGGPVLITSATVLMSYLPGVPAHYGKPYLGPRPLDCWFYDDFAAMIYFFLPAGLLLNMNLLFCLFTTHSMWKHSSQVKKLISKSDNHSKVSRTSFYHYLKLFLTMGLGSVLHSIFFALEKLDVYSLSLASDLYNGLQGLPLFIVFTCNYRTLRLLRAKFTPSTSTVQQTSPPTSSTQQTEITSDSSVRSTVQTIS